MTKKETDIIAENKRLRRENEYLRHRLASLGESFSEDKESGFERRFADVSRVATASHKKTYFGYLVGRFQASFLFRLWDRTRFAVRGFFLATKIWNFLVWFFVILGFGTQFVLFVSAAAVLLPTIVLISLLLGVFGFFVYRKRNRELVAMQNAAPQKKIYLVFAPKRWEKHRYFCDMIEDFAEDDVVFLVCSSLSDCGYRGLRAISPSLYAVHISYYFSLKKTLKDRNFVFLT